MTTPKLPPFVDIPSSLRAECMALVEDAVRHADMSRGEVGAYEVLATFVAERVLLERRTPPTEPDPQERVRELEWLLRDARGYVADHGHWAPARELLARIDVALKQTRG